MLWTIIVILVVLWLLGFLGHVGGGLIHLRRRLVDRDGAHIVPRI